MTELDKRIIKLLDELKGCFQKKFREIDRYDNVRYSFLSFKITHLGNFKEKYKRLFIDEGI